jgi:hypothetical protein
MKSLTSTQIDQLESMRILTADLLEIQLTTPLYFTNAGYDLSIATATSGGTQTYAAYGNFISFSGIREIEETRVNNVSITLSAIGTALQNLFLNDHYLHRAVRIYRVLFDTDTGGTITDPILLYEGSITGATISDSVQESTIEVTTSNQFYDFDRTAGRLTNSGSQQFWYPDDLGFQFSTEDVTEIAWGKNI